MNEDVVQASMQIILFAGNARLKCQEALNCVSSFDIETAKTKLKEAQQEIVKAHTIQTDNIQDEVRGEKKEYCLLFAHAQDTLMTINSEINIAKQLIRIFDNYEERLQKIEKMVSQEHPVR